MVKIIKLVLCFCVMIFSLVMIYNYYSYDVVRDDGEIVLSDDVSGNKLISLLKDKYNNNEVSFYLEIPDVLEVPVFQTDDNDFYLNHDEYRKFNKRGAVFLDYRIASLNSKKLIVYGHNSTYRDLPFTKLLNYKEKSFFVDHPVINIYSDTGKKSYRIFSSYVESSDFDYLNLNSFNNLSFYEHLQKLKDKSLYDTGVLVSNDSKVLILQTCTYDGSIENGVNYHIVIGVLE